MKCQILFSRKSKKNISKCCLLTFLPSIQNVTYFRPDPGMRESGLDKQNVMRLRINRIALIQELRVEHVLRYLTETGILTEDDLKQIGAGSTPADKARVLVDILPGIYLSATLLTLAMLNKLRHHAHF